MPSGGEAGYTRGHRRDVRCCVDRVPLLSPLQCMGVVTITKWKYAHVPAREFFYNIARSRCPTRHFLPVYPIFFSPLRVYRKSCVAGNV
jgi:hypothetical protein